MGGPGKVPSCELTAGPKRKEMKSGEDLLSRLRSIETGVVQGKRNVTRKQEPLKQEAAQWW